MGLGASAMVAMHSSVDMQTSMPTAGVVIGGVISRGPFKPLRVGATIRYGYYGRRPQSTRIQSLFPDVEGLLPLETRTVNVHLVCWENEIVCLRNRVLMQTPQPRPHSMGRLQLHGHALCSIVLSFIGRLTPWSLSKTLRHMVVRHGAALYVPAAESLRQEPLGSIDARVSMFLKVEKVFAEDPAEKAPRAIQYRGPRFNLVLGRFILAYEEAFYRAFNHVNASRCHTSKGLTPDARAALLWELWSKNPRPAALNVDASRFDAHVTVEMLLLESLYYESSFPNCRLLRWLLRCQRRNRGCGKFGTTYTLKGGRMSGDVNTALGNTLIQMTVLSFLAGRSFDLVVEGDDAVIFGDVDDITRLEAVITSKALAVGFQLKVSKALYLEQLEYCSTRVIRSQSGDVRAIREWPRPLAMDRYTVKIVSGQRATNRKARTMAVCFMSLYSGLPVYEEWARYLLSWSDPSFGVDESQDRRLWFIAAEACVGTGDQVPADGLRSSFYMATTIEPSEQLRVEGLLRDQRGPHPAYILGGELRALRRAAAQLQNSAPSS
ncbi:hypothetical protein 2 [Xinzhou nematode virus 7]|uniref:hypothetical protein 2 n=1 Tax=Xinzhou nematode virus 7 TaxID=1923775 RepID=UPI00090C181C|nr:hypothetical protein 2 [Xinzhou nematode virus 7]APG76649.1 hypothetical protein 2 [Xinzhou nematode virus 7]